jgi:hypothetical protein
MAAEALTELVAIRATPNEPDAEGLITAISRMGYAIEEAFADLIDNSIDAAASAVLVRFIRDDSAVKRIVVADNGHGMSEQVLARAMKFGAKTAHAVSDLGRYGMGLKSASFSQARSLSVLSRAHGRVAGRRWTLESIAKGWLCEELDPVRVAELFRQPWGNVAMQNSGTLVIWDSLDRFKQDRAGVDATLDRLNREIPKHLGLVFHRFLQRGQLSISLDFVQVRGQVPPAVTSVRPLDPFGYPQSGHARYPRRFIFTVPRLAALNLTAHIWPPKSKAEGYRLGGGRVAQRQGFYFYRNDRLIQAGGWNGWRDSDSEPHASLARAAIDLPPEADSIFSLNVQKSAVDVPPGFRAALESSQSDEGRIADYIPDAEGVYRSAEDEETSEDPLVPGRGVLKRLQREVIDAAEIIDGKVREMDFEWTTLNEDEFFRINRESRTILLNEGLRGAVLQGTRASAADAPLVKALLFYLLKDQIDIKSLWAARAEQLRQLSRVLAIAARLQL